MDTQTSIIPPAISEWWLGQTARDQLILKGLALAWLIVMGWLLVLKPLWAAQADAEVNLNAAVQKKQTILAAAQTKAVLEGRSGQGSGPIERVNLRVAISSTTQARGLKLVRIQPSADGKLTVWMNDVAADQLFGWLSELNTRYGIRVVSASIQPDRDDPTVQGQIQFEAP